LRDVELNIRIDPSPIHVIAATTRVPPPGRRGTSLEDYAPHFQRECSMSHPPTQGEFAAAVPGTHGLKNEGRFRGPCLRPLMALSAVRVGLGSSRWATPAAWSTVSVMAGID
jgi:hypothetical protein